MGKTVATAKSGRVGAPRPRHASHFPIRPLGDALPKFFIFVSRVAPSVDSRLLPAQSQAGALSLRARVSGAGVGALSHERDDIVSCRSEHTAPGFFV